MKNRWTMIEKELRKGYFLSPFHLKSRLLCSSGELKTPDISKHRYD